MISLNNIDNLFTAEDAEFAEQNHRITSSTKPRTFRRNPCFCAVNFHCGTDDRIGPFI
jgi:hypothetical protein